MVRAGNTLHLRDSECLVRFLGFSYLATLKLFDVLARNKVDVAKNCSHFIEMKIFGSPQANID